jgi:wyosine [tRNA(Phe)-imidazoG37] synthetase (radical SAM superfamily)
MIDYNHLFGPVPSRRFGRSLGIDLMPYKTCSFDCIFCQLGRTTDKTVTRREYVKTDDVIEELTDWLKADGKADYITLSGSGEPTLHSKFGEICDYVRSATTIPCVLLTNGSLLHQTEVREMAASADIVKASLSAWNQVSFEHINRPHETLQLKNVMEGLRYFRSEFKGELWMEVFLVWGTNTVPADVSKIAGLVQSVKPDRVQLNTAVRPPAEAYAFAAPKNTMETLAGLFDPPADVIPEFSTDNSKPVEANEGDILAMLERRPCTMDQIAQVFGMHRNEVSKYIGKLMRTGRIREMHTNDGVYYSGTFTQENSHANV